MKNCFNGSIFKMAKEIEVRYIWVTLVNVYDRQSKQAISLHCSEKGTTWFTQNLLKIKAKSRKFLHFMFQCFKNKQIMD